MGPFRFSVFTQRSVVCVPEVPVHRRMPLRGSHVTVFTPFKNAMERGGSPVALNQTLGGTQGYTPYIPCSPR